MSGKPVSPHSRSWVQYFPVAESPGAHTPDDPVGSKPPKVVCHTIPSDSKAFGDLDLRDSWIVSHEIHDPAPGVGGRILLGSAGFLLCSPMCSLLCSACTGVALSPVSDLASLPVGGLVRLGKRKAQTQDAARLPGPCRPGVPCLVTEFPDTADPSPPGFDHSRAVEAVSRTRVGGVATAILRLRERSSPGGAGLRSEG